MAVRRIVKSILITLAVILIAVVVVSYWKVSRISSAKRYVSVAQRFMNPSFEVDPDFYSEYDVPFALRTKHDFAVHYLLKSVEIGYPEYSGAYYNLGLLFLERDCEVAEYYFELNSRVTGTPEARALLEDLRSVGCEKFVLRFALSTSGSAQEETAKRSQASEP